MALISNIRDSADQPQMQFQFEVEIEGGLVVQKLKGKHTFRVNSVTIPETSVDTVEVNFKNSKVMFAGRDSSPHSLTVNFWDEQGMKLYRAFQQWHMQIRNPVNGGGLNKAAYKGAMVVRMIDVDGTSPNSVASFFNVWPSSVGDVSLSYESSDKISFDVTFAYDESVFGGKKIENVSKALQAVSNFSGISNMV